MRKIVLIAALFLGVRGAQAQFFKKVLDQVKQTTQNRANSKADATTNKAIDKVGGGTSTGSGSGSGGSDSAAADQAINIMNKLVGGGGVSAADSAKAIQSYRTANGGSGVFYQLVTVMTGQMNRRDTSSVWMTSGGEGRKDMTMFGSGRIVTIGRIAEPTYSITLDDGQKTFSLNVIDTSLINNSQGYKIEKLGSETAAGYPCTHVRITSSIGKGAFKSSSVSEVWLSTAVPSYTMLKNGLLAASQQIGMMKALHDAGVDGFFIKMTASGKDYSVTMEINQIKEGRFPASLFEIPVGYAQSNEGIMGALMRSGMKQKQ